MNKDWLDISVLEDYLDGKLDARSMNRVEREALEDPFVAEALAGLSASPKRPFDTVSLLQKQLHERIAEQHTAKKTAVITWQRLSIAAAAAVVCISVSIMFWMREENRQKELAAVPKKVEVMIAAKAPAAKAPAITPAPVAANEISATREKQRVDKVIEAAKDDVYAARLSRKAAVNLAKDSAAGQLNDVAIVAKGSQRKMSVTGSVATIQQGRSIPMITGVIVSEYDKKPVPGASVKIEGTTLAAITDANGVFKINTDTALKGAKIRADFIGFEGKELIANVNEPVNISLKPDNLSLSEVVVGGFDRANSAKKKDDARFSNALLGKVEGIAIQQKDQIMIRGLGNAFTAPINAASPVGGWSKFTAYIKANNVFTKDIKTGQKVELSFMIDKEGVPHDIRIVKGAERKYEQEAIRLIKKGPKWEVPKTAGSRMTFTFDF